MAFDDKAREAGRFARLVAAQAERPDLLALVRRRRRMRAVGSASAVAILALGVIALGSLRSSQDPVAAGASTTITALETTSTLDVCPLTKPPGDFIPPGQVSVEAPDVRGMVWFGTSFLWTRLPPEGATWTGLPETRPGIFRNKVFFWAEGYNAVEDPASMTLRARELATGELIEFSGGDMTGGFRPDVGHFMVVGIELSAGCWELTADYEGSVLGFVVEIGG